jgi:hypothetical protein
MPNSDSDQWQRQLSGEWQQRATALAALEPGWDGEGSAAPSADLLAAVSALVRQLPESVPEPCLYAEADGCVNLAWPSGLLVCLAEDYMLWVDGSAAAVLIDLDVVANPSVCAAQVAQICKSQ